MVKAAFTLSSENTKELLKNWNYTFKEKNKEYNLSVDLDSPLKCLDNNTLYVDTIVKDINTNAFYKIRGGVIYTWDTDEYILDYFPVLQSNEVQFDLVTTM